MGRTSANGGLPPRPYGATGGFAGGARPLPPALERTTRLTGALLAPAPTRDAAEVQVFVDDSGGRKGLMRLAGVLVAVVSVGFLAAIGAAVAAPSVMPVVEVGDVMPFVVPPAAAPPPPPPPPAPTAAPKHKTTSGSGTGSHPPRRPHKPRSSRHA
jgi:hypothetical protein